MRSAANGVGRAGCLAALLTCIAAAACGPHPDAVVAHVDVPVRLADVKKLHDPPDVVVFVARRHRDRLDAAQGMRGCAHAGAACLVVAPIVAWSMLFPETWDEARVVRADRLTYEGRFDLQGRLIEATVHEERQVRLIQVLVLEELGQRHVVESARAPLLADGGLGPFARSPILPQFDLTAEYRLSLAHARAEQHAALLVEYGRWLQEEALGWLPDALLSESDETAVQVLGRLCSDEASDERHRLCIGLLRKLGASAGPRTAAAGLTQALALGSNGAELAPAFVETLVRHTCAQPERDLARVAAFGLASHDGTTPWSAALLRLAQTRLRACPSAERRALLATLLDRPAAHAELRPQLVSPEFDDLVLPRLQPDEPALRRAILDSMETAGDDTEHIASFLRSGQAPSAHELEVFARSYLKPSGWAASPRRPWLLELMFRAHGRPPLVARARAVIEAELAQADAPRRPPLRAALLALGDQRQALPASIGLDPGTSGYEYYAVVRAFELAGCTSDEIQRLRETRPQAGVSDDDRGALCERPQRKPPA